jgi:peptidoglycan hydrolase CwlO-like protein
MKKKIVLITTIGILLILFLLSIGNRVQAADPCPESMPIQERYLCLQEELQNLESSQGSLEKSLKNEEYQQLSLKEKISYITNQITQTEKIIDLLHLEITAQDVEITILAEEIQQKEDELSVLNQEVRTLEQTVNERIRESYKYSYVGALEFFFDVKNLDSIIRKTKYLVETRLRDKGYLEEFADKMNDLENDEEILATKKAEIQVKRNEVEDEKERLVEEKANLDSAQKEKNYLLAESEKRESAYRTELAQTTAAISAIDEAISDVVIELFNTGQLGSGMSVVAGQTIGYQGHTGCSFGSHLHFDIRDKYNNRLNPATYLNGGTVWYPVTSKIYKSPQNGAILTQGYKPDSHRAWDMYSSIEGARGGTYTVPTGICWIVDYYIRTFDRNWAYLTGEGARVMAVASGKVYYGVIIPDGPNGSKYPAKYALVVHNDGNKSFYLHLK